MESQFAHLRQRDTSVSMLRVKMSRRRSQSQKENRKRVVNTRRQLDKLQEMDVSSLDGSIAVANMSVIQEKPQNAKPAKNVAVEERLKQLERWKERKALEKEKKEREQKGVFKTGLYRPKDSTTLVALPLVSTALKRANETKVTMAPPQTTRVTRSMKQQQQPLKTQDINALPKRAQPPMERSTKSRVAVVKPSPIVNTKTSAVGPTLRTMSTRSTNRPPVTAAPVVKGKPKDHSADERTTVSRAVIKPLAPPSGMNKNSKASAKSTAQPTGLKEAKLEETIIQEPVENSHSPLPSLTSCSKEEEMVADQAAADPVVDSVQVPSSFAPEGFVFQAPAGLSSFKFEPLSPRSADAFLTPSNSFNLTPVVFNAEPPTPPKSPAGLSPRTSPTVAPATPDSLVELKHDVPYFRGEIANETERLTALSVHWESKVEDESIPEEMRDRMRTAVGQARLLMKERFNQFSGLVDDCELGRGEKITTCTDLQGFWDMVYYQVEDVNKKFESLKEAESRGWVEEHKPPPRQRKVVKKPSAPAPAKPTGTKAAAAKSRLAAVKAAMKAKQQAAEAERAAKDASNAEGTCLNAEEPQIQEGAQIQDVVTFDGGFFKVESPAKPRDPVRRSNRLSAAVLPQTTSSTTLTPRRVTRRSLALGQTPVHAVASPSQPGLHLAHFSLALNQTPIQASPSQRGTPRSSKKKKDNVNVSLCHNSVKKVFADENQLDERSVLLEVSNQNNTATVSELDTPMLVDSLPPTSASEEQAEPVEAAHLDALVCPRLYPSPCKTPSLSSQCPRFQSSQSFTLSPYVTSNQPSISPVQIPAENQESVCCSADSSLVGEISGLDFERYLQPSLRCSLSPRESVATEMLSPLAVDVEMESPSGQSEDLLSQQEPALSGVSSELTLQSPQVNPSVSALLLFTPDLKDRIRQSVCPSDLMVFTPPSNV